MKNQKIYALDKMAHLINISVLLIFAEPAVNSGPKAQNEPGVAKFY